MHHAAEHDQAHILRMLFNEFNGNVDLQSALVLCTFVFAKTSLSHCASFCVTLKKGNDLSHNCRTFQLFGFSHLFMWGSASANQCQKRGLIHFLCFSALGCFDIILAAEFSLDIRRKIVQDEMDMRIVNNTWWIIVCGCLQIWKRFVKWKVFWGDWWYVMFRKRFYNWLMGVWWMREFQIKVDGMRRKLRCGLSQLSFN